MCLAAQPSKGNVHYVIERVRFLITIVQYAETVKKSDEGHGRREYYESVMKKAEELVPQFPTIVPDDLSFLVQAAAGIDSVMVSDAAEAEDVPGEYPGGLGGSFQINIFLKCGSWDVTCTAVTTIRPDYQSDMRLLIETSDNKLQMYIFGFPYHDDVLVSDFDDDSDLFVFPYLLTLETNEDDERLLELVTLGADVASELNVTFGSGLPSSPSVVIDIQDADISGVLEEHGFATYIDEYTRVKDIM